MYDQEGVDPYVDPATGVFINLLGITDATLLAAAEADLVYLRTAELAAHGPLGNFDLSHLQAIHAYLFGDVYPWTGRLRTVNSGRGAISFAPVMFMERYAMSVFAELAVEKRLKGLDVDAFTERAAHYLAEINAVHPFREGNGRTQREYLRQLARHAGYTLSWRSVSREEMIAASIAGMNGNRAPLKNLLRERLR